MLICHLTLAPEARSRRPRGGSGPEPAAASIRGKQITHRKRSLKRNKPSITRQAASRKGHTNNRNDTCEQDNSTKTYCAPGLAKVQSHWNVCVYIYIYIYIYRLIYIYIYVEHAAEDSIENPPERLLNKTTMIWKMPQKMGLGFRV